MSKLSRNKKPAKPQLNSSSDDFRDDPPKPKVAAVASAATTKENEDDSLSAAEGPEQLADCPFCGKDFRCGFKQCSLLSAVSRSRNLKRQDGGGVFWTFNIVLWIRKFYLDPEL